MNRAIRPDDTPLFLKSPFFHRLFDSTHSFLPIIGMQELYPGWVRTGKATGRQTVDRFQFGRPTVHARLDVPFERAHASDLLGHPQSLLAFAQRFLESRAPLDDFLDIDIRLCAAI